MDENEQKRIERAIYTAIGFGGVIFLFLPLAVVSLASLDGSQFFTFPPTELNITWFKELAQSPEWRESIWYSLQISSAVSVLSAFVGGAAGIALARVTQRFEAPLRLAVVAPMVVPTIVLAVGFYELMLKAGLIGSIAPFILINLLLTVPIVIVIVSAAARAIDINVELASLACGAGPVRTLLRVTVPLVLPSILAGAVLAFVLTLDEVVVSGFLIAPGKTPVAVKMFGEIQTGLSPLVTAMATLFILGAIAVGAVVVAVQNVRSIKRAR